MSPEKLEIAPQSAGAVSLRAGEHARIVNTEGAQVVDTWAFNRELLTEFMSMEHTRTALARIMPKVGDSLVTNQRRPILTVVEDTTPGIHDTMMAACDRYRYQLLGCAEYHDNCTDNLAEGLAELGLTPPETPSPLNLFMNIPVLAGGALGIEPPVCKPRDYVLLRAEMDCIVAFSACPQDIVPNVNGVDCTPTEAHFQIV